MFKRSNRNNRLSSLSMLCLVSAAIFALAAERPVMAAGDVIASEEYGILTITGDEFGNQIEVTERPGYVEVTGLDTKITGGNGRYFDLGNNTLIFDLYNNEIQDIRIELMDGDDDVHIHSLESVANITVDTGKGRGYIAANNLKAMKGAFHGWILSIDLQNSDFDTSLMVIADEQVLTDISAGLDRGGRYSTILWGADNLSASQIRAHSLYVRTNGMNGFGTNTVTMNGLHVAEDAEFYGDDGDDAFIIYNAQIDGDAKFLTNNPESAADTLGVDKVDVRNVTVGGELRVQSGVDRLGDSLEVRDSSMNRLSFEAGNGTNEFLVKDTGINRELTFYGGAARDIVNMEGVGIESGDMRLYTGEGNDTVDAKSVQASGVLIVSLGSGNDGLTISGQSSAWLADLDGGSNSGGRDTLLFSGRFDRTDITGFENNQAPILDAGSQLGSEVVARRPRW